MAPARGAKDLDPPHAPTVIFFFEDGGSPGRLEEAGPTGAGFEFRVGAEQLAFAAFAYVIAGFFVMDEFSGKRGFGAAFSTHVIFLGRQFFHPIFIREFLLLRQQRRGTTESVYRLLIRLRRHRRRR